MSLAAEISALANPTPIFEDPEDIQDDTKACLTESYAEEGELTGESVGSTKLRRQAALLLELEDKRYKGKRVSRKKLEQESESSEDGDDQHDQDGSDGKDEEESEPSGDEVIKSSGEEQTDSDEGHLFAFRQKVSINEIAPAQKYHSSKQSNERTQLKKDFAFEDNGDYSKYADESSDEEEMTEDEESGQDGEDEEEEEQTAGASQVEEGGIQSFSRQSVDEEMAKGRAVQAQLNIWDSLLEARIRLQRVLIVVNQLPQPDAWQQVRDAGREDYEQLVKEGQGKLFNVLEQLVQLQSSLLAHNPETKYLASCPQGPALQTDDQVNNDDEEITSESDIEEGEEKKVERKKISVPQKRKLKAADYPELISKRHKEFRQYRNQVLKKWYDKTRVASGKLSKGFTAFEQSTLKQIEQILSDHQRLVRRTQLKRTAYQVIGKAEASKRNEEEIADNEEDVQQDHLPSREHLKDYDEEIFDDDDFYHHLLRELIERKTSNTSDPVALSRQWLEVQKLRRKVKRQVDTKASKGRKVRYHVHPKLVNLMAPSHKSSWTDEQRDDLFSSLFGKRHNDASIGECGQSTVTMNQ